MTGLTPDIVRKIHELLHNRQVIQAIQVYQQATGVGIAEAKEAVEEMAQVEYAKPPSDVRNFDNPVLEARIKSLLARGKKIDAVKIYREEYGVGLKEAKDAVDRMEASMQTDPSSISQPYEPAIGGDPFADNNRVNGRTIVLVAVALAVAICGLAVFVLLLNL